MSLSAENANTLIVFYGDSLDGVHPDKLDPWHVHCNDLELLMNAVRAEERAKAIEVVRPFAEAYHFWNGAGGGVHDDMEIDDQGRIVVAHLRRAAAYITDSEGGA